VPGHQVPAASGLYNFARITAGSFAASVVTTAWDRLETVHQTRLSEVIAAQDPTFTGATHALRAAGLTAQQAVAAVTNQAISQSYLLATIDIFRISAILMVVLVPTVWLTHKAKTQAGASAAAD
jgi:DHA2 family multidrug resistance protein